MPTSTVRAACSSERLPLTRPSPRPARTKTGRSKELEDAAPEPFVQISEEDAKELGIKHGDMCLVEAKRGSIEVAAKVGEIAKGNLFVPFHYVRRRSCFLRLRRAC